MIKNLPLALLLIALSLSCVTPCNKVSITDLNVHDLCLFESCLFDVQCSSGVCTGNYDSPGVCTLETYVWILIGLGVLIVITGIILCCCKRRKQKFNIILANSD